MKAAALKHKDGMIVVSDSRRNASKLHTLARAELGKQAAYAAARTGLSLEFCAKMVIHRASRRLEE